MTRLSEISYPELSSDRTLRCRQFTAAADRLQGKSLSTALSEVSAEFLRLWNVLPSSPRGFWVVAVAADGRLVSLAVVDQQAGQVRTDFFSIDEKCSLSDIKLVYLTRAQMPQSSTAAHRLEAYLQAAVAAPPG